MSQVNITQNTNTVEINTTNNQIVVNDPSNNIVNIVQPITTVLEVISAGPQGPPGDPSIFTGSFVSTSSFNSFTSSYNTGSFTGSFTGSLLGTASFANSALSVLIESLSPILVDSYIGTRLQPTNSTYNGFIINRSVNGATGFISKNPDNTGNGAISGFSALGSGSTYYDGGISMNFVNNGYYIPYLRNSGFIYSPLTARFIADTLEFRTGPLASATSKLTISNSGDVNIPTGSLTVTNGITGSLFGTSSWAQNSSTSSYAPNYVPYTGATQNVDLGEYSLSTPIIINDFNQDSYNQVRLDGIGVSLTTEDLLSGDSNTFDVLPTNTYSKKYTAAPGFQVLTNVTEPIEAGKIVWNEADGTFDMGLLNGVTLQAGQEMHMYAKASGVIANGDAVQFAGAQGDHLLVKKAVPSEITANPEYFVGVATQDFTNNQFGYVTVFGQVRDLDTDSYLEGTVLYYQSMGVTDGLLTDTRPTGPNAKIIVAAVVRSHQNQGAIFVRPHVMPMIGDLQNVEINTGSLSTGDLLIYDSSSQVWVNSKQLSGSYGLTGSLHINSVLNLTPTHPLPSGLLTGSIVVSGSGINCKPYFWNGSTWASMI
jgi:hypothetical protein